MQVTSSADVDRRSRMDPNMGAEEARGAALAPGGADNGNVNAARAAAPAVRAAAAGGVADNGNVNAARAAAPAVHLPNIQARGAVGVNIHQPVPPDFAPKFLSSMPDVSRSSLAELGSPAYRWPSVYE